MFIRGRLALLISRPACGEQVHECGRCAKALQRPPLRPAKVGGFDFLSLADRGAAPPFMCRAGSSALLPCRFIRTAAVTAQSFPLPAVSPLIRHRHRCTKRVFYKSKSDPGREKAGIGPSVPQPRSFSNCRLRPRLRRTMAFPWVLYGLVAETIAGVGWEEEVQGDRRLGQHVRCQSHSFGTRPCGQTS